MEVNIEINMSDEVILREIGRRLVQYRIDAGLTQRELAEKAGVSNTTIERIEAGKISQMVSYIRILKILGLVEKLNTLVPDSDINPLDILRMKGQARKRVSRKVQKEEHNPWVWGEDK